VLPIVGTVGLVTRILYMAKRESIIKFYNGNGTISSVKAPQGSKINFGLDNNGIGLTINF